MPIFARIYHWLFPPRPVFDVSSSPEAIRAEIARLQRKRSWWDCERVDKQDERLPCSCPDCTEIARLERLAGLLP